MTSETDVATVVVRAWAEPEIGPGRIRARVLVVTGSDAVSREVGVAAGVPSILDLVARALRAALPFAAADRAGEDGTPDDVELS